MKIVINALSARRGGAQTYLRYLLDHAPDRDSRGHPIEIFLLAPESLPYPTRGPVQRLPVPRTTENPFARALWEHWVLPRLLRNTRADVLFTPGGTSTLRPSAPSKTVTMFRNMIPFDRAQLKRYPFGYERIRMTMLKGVMRRAMTRADLVIFISNYAHRIVDAEVGPLRNFVVIPHGVSDRFRVRGDRLVRPAWAPDGYLLYVSTLDYYKNQVEVVRGFLQARSALGLTEKLLLIGPGNPGYVALVREEIARARAEEHVVLVGSVPHDDLPALYQNARVNIFASESENCPNILLEALASGRPVVCSDHDPMPEFAGDAVIYFQPRDPNSLANALANAMRDAATENALGLRAAARSERYRSTESARRTWQAIQACAELPDGTTRLVESG